MRIFGHQLVILSLASLSMVGASLAPLDAADARGMRGGGVHARSAVHGARPPAGGARARPARPPGGQRPPGGARPPAGGQRPPPPGGGHRPPPPPPRVADPRWNHPIGTAAAIATTAAVIGSIVYSLPPSCTSVIVDGLTYERCGSTWYKPRYYGSSVEYVVVESPY